MEKMLDADFVSSPDRTLAAVPGGGDGVSFKPLELRPRSRESPQLSQTTDKSQHFKLKFDGLENAGEATAYLRGRHFERFLLHASQASRDSAEMFI